jgi:large subunit ribosomal protein L25
MAKNIKLNATKRIAHGSGEARRVRRAGGIPAALSRLSRETDTIQLDAHEYMMAMRNEVSDQVLVELALDGASIHALLREVQRDVMTGDPIHADFSEVDMNKKIRASVLVRLSGEPVGVAVGGGILSQATHEIEVECLPSDLVDAIEIDVSGLQLGEDVTVADLKIPEGITVFTAADTAVASVSAPAAEEEEAAPADGEPAQPEVLAKGKEKNADAEEGADDKAAKK